MQRARAASFSPPTPSDPRFHLARTAADPCGAQVCTCIRRRILVRGRIALIGHPCFGSPSSSTGQLCSRNES
jgi:hypothetical protein